MQAPSNNDAPHDTTTPPLPVLTGAPLIPTTLADTERLRFYTIAVDVLSLILAEIVGGAFLDIAAAKYLGNTLVVGFCSAGIVSVAAYFLVAAPGRHSRSFRVKRIMLDVIFVSVLLTALGLALQLPLLPVSLVFLVNGIAGPIGLLLSLALVPSRDTAR